MDNLKNLLELIPPGKTIPEFGKMIFPHLSFNNSRDRAFAGKSVKQLIGGKSIKYETLENIAKVTGKDYNKILGYGSEK